MTGRSVALLLASAAAAAACRQLKPGLPWDAFAIRACCSLAAVWAVCGWFVATHPSPNDRSRSSSLATDLFMAAAALGAIGIALICGTLVPLTVERLIPRFADGMSVIRMPRTEGPADLLALLIGLAFWRRGQRHSAQPAAALLVGLLLTLWMALLIPGGLLGDPTELLIPRPRFAPGWLLWTHVIEFGGGLLLVTGAWLRDREYRRLRASAWPLELRRLLAPYPGTLATYLLSAGAAALVLTMGVFHVVRPGGITIVSGVLGFVALLATGIAMLYWSHRSWSDNLAGLGLGLVAVSVVTLFCTFSADQAGIEYAARLPRRLTMAHLALAAVTLVYLWLPHFWRQQLHDNDVAWTTAGRMSPLTLRAGFLIAALGVLVGYYLALWPRHRLALATSLGTWQWAGGLLGYLMLARITARAARNYGNASFAVLSLATVVGGALFVFVRWPAGALRGWIVEHAPLLFISAALMAWAMSHRVSGGRSAVFARPLWLAALLVLPTLALLNASGRPVGEWLNLPRWWSIPGRLSQPWMRPATLACVAALYALAGWREGRTLLRWLGGALAVAAGASLYATYRL